MNQGDSSSQRKLSGTESQIFATGRPHQVNVYKNYEFQRDIDGVPTVSATSDTTMVIIMILLEPSFIE